MKNFYAGHNIGYNRCQVLNLNVSLFPLRLYAQETRNIYANTSIVSLSLSLTCITYDTSIPSTMKECFETRYLSIKDKAVSFVSSCSTIFEIFEKEQIYFSIKFPARERSFASLLPSSTLFNFFKYLNSSHSDQHFPPFLFPTISNREFLQDEFARSCKKFVLKFDSDRSSSLLFS